MTALSTSNVDSEALLVFLWSNLSLLFDQGPHLLQMPAKYGYLDIV